jgi:hypothetical protein
MSEARMSHEDLEKFAARLAEMRDQAIADRKDSSLYEYYAGEAQAFRLALLSLHTWSDGAYGESWDEQGEQKGSKQ